MSLYWRLRLFNWPICSQYVWPISKIQSNIISALFLTSNECHSFYYTLIFIQTSSTSIPQTLLIVRKDRVFRVAAPTLCSIFFMMVHSLYCHLMKAYYFQISVFSVRYFISDNLMLASTFLFLFCFVFLCDSMTSVTIYLAILNWNKQIWVHDHYKGEKKIFKYVCFFSSVVEYTSRINYTTTSSASGHGKRESHYLAFRLRFQNVLCLT